MSSGTRTIFTYALACTLAVFVSQHHGTTTALADCPDGGELVVSEDHWPALQGGDGEWIVPAQNGDVNADGQVNITDAVFLLNTLFAGGPMPQTLVAVTCDTGETGEICDNGIDDDGDDLVDCDDPDCAAACPESDCGNAVDDDGDGLVDCDDPDCADACPPVSSCSIRFLNAVVCAGQGFGASLSIACADKQLDSVSAVWSDCIEVPAESACNLCITGAATACGSFNICGPLDLVEDHVYFIIFAFNNGTGALEMLYQEQAGDCTVSPPPIPGAGGEKNADDLGAWIPVPMGYGSVDESDR